MTKKDKNNFLIKVSIHAAALLYEMDNAKVDTEEANQLKVLLEKHLEYAYEQPIIRSKPFLQNLENKFDTAIRKTAQEHKIRL